MDKKKKQEEEEMGLQKQEDGPDPKALITSQFTEQVGLAQADSQVHEKRMEEFINEKMGVNKEAAEAPKIRTDEDKLYDIADLVKGEESTSDGITGYLGC